MFICRSNSYKIWITLIAVMSFFAVSSLAEIRGTWSERADGYEEQSDTSVPEEIPSDCDQVMTVRGDRLVGDVTGIEAEGVLHLAGQQFEGDMLVVVPKLQKVTLACDAKEAGYDKVVLSNGDRIQCTVRELRSDTLLVGTELAGDLSIDLSAVRSITLSLEPDNVLVDSEFSEGEMSPWRAERGAWSVVDEALIFRVSGQHGWLFTKLSQSKAVTVEAKVEAIEGHSLYCRFALFAEDRRHEHGKTCVFAQFQDNNYRLGKSSNRGRNELVSNNYGNSRRATFRVSYDPSTGKAKLWRDLEELGEYAVPDGPKSGNYVMFFSGASLSVSSLRVFSGVVPPSAEEPDVGRDRDLIIFTNGDRVSVNSVTMAGENAKIETPFGVMDMPKSKIQRILFRKGVEETPSQAKGDVLAKASWSRLTLQLESLTGDHLIGKAEHMGKVKLNRPLIKSIDFIETE